MAHAQIEKVSDMTQSHIFIKCMVTEKYVWRDHWEVSEQNAE